MSCPSNLFWNQSIHQCDFTTGPKTPDDDGDYLDHSRTLPPGHRERHTDSPVGDTNDNIEVTTY